MEEGNVIVSEWTSTVVCGSLRQETKRKTFVRLGLKQQVLDRSTCGLQSKPHIPAL